MGDSYSNIRFRVTDEQDKVEFSNVSDGDTFCYSTVYVDKTFDVYLVKDLPAQDGIYWAKVFYDKAERWGQNALELLILFGTMELFLLILPRPHGRRGARTASCRAAGRKRSPSTSISSLTARSLRCCAWRWRRSTPM